MNNLIELHDSTVVRITRCSDSFVVHFAPAYVHRSQGRPGFDPGTGWVQDVDLVISEFVVESGFTEMPVDLDGGSLRVGTDVFENLIPIPLDVGAAIQFSAIGKSGESLLIRGNAATVFSVGEARYVEDFPGGE